MLDSILNNILNRTRTKTLCVITAEGQLVHGAGDVAALDTESLSVLIAGQMAATQGICDILKQDMFKSIYQEGEKNLHIFSLNHKYFLLSISDKKAYSGQIQFEVLNATSKLLKELKSRENSVLSRHTEELMFEEIKDEEIDRLFGV